MASEPASAPSALGEKIEPKTALEFITSECRDLLEFLEKKGYWSGFSSTEKNAIVLEHLTTDLSDWGIGVQEYVGLSDDDAKEIITSVLARPENNENNEIDETPDQRYSRIQGNSRI